MRTFEQVLSLWHHVHLALQQGSQDDSEPVAQAEPKGYADSEGGKW